jgi:hypothetical protein
MTIDIPLLKMAGFFHSYSWYLLVIFFLQATKKMMVIVFYNVANSLAIWSTFNTFISVFSLSIFELTKKSASSYSLIKPCPIKAKTFSCCEFLSVATEATS